MRAEAEEHLKHIQIAYKQLQEHNGAAVTAPVEVAPPSRVSEQSAELTPEKPAAEAPTLSLGGAPGTQTGPHFTQEVEEIVSQHIGKLGTALAIVDLTGSNRYSQFLLLAQLGLMARDGRNIVSLLWYKDMGEIRLIDKQSKSGMWQSLTGGSSSQSKYVLEIYRNNGMLFLSIAGQVNDNVKKIIYDFLLNRKLQAQP